MEFLNKLKTYLLAWGIPGLFVIAFLDSAAVPMAGGPDALVLLLAWQQPLQWPFIVLVAAIGSTLGSLVLYYLGYAGGELALARFKSEKRLWVQEKLNRNAVGAVLVAVVAPPPFPTKLVILAAGAFKMPLGKFVFGVFGGRVFRYGLEAYLGARFGGQAASILKSQYPMISLGLIAGVVSLILFRRLRGSNEANLEI